MRAFIIGMITFGIGFSLQAQNEKEAVKKVLEVYFDGWTTSDTSKLTAIMHPSCHLKFFRDNEFTDITKQSYLSRFGAVKSRDNSIKTKIRSVDVTGNAASAKITIETAKAIFTDYFNLIKTNQGWMIVDKVTSRKDKKPLPEKS